MMTPKVKRLHVFHNAEDDSHARFRATINLESKELNRIEVTAHSLETLVEKLAKEWEVEWRGDRNELRRTLTMGYSLVAESFS